MSKEALARVIEEKGLLRLAEPVELASGAMSREFVDVKRALARGEDLALACRTILGRLDAEGIEFDAVGGMTMGADQFAHGMAVLSGKDWFVVRKAPKGRGTNRRIEGSELGAATRVVIVEDTVTTGGSIRDAYEVIGEESGARVVAAVTVLDRGDKIGGFFEAEGVPYLPMLSWRDIGMEPPGG